MAQRNWTSFFSVSAVLSSFAVLTCCLPAAVLGAVGVAGLAAAIAPARPWLLVLSALLLVGGYVQMVRGARCGIRGNRINLVLLALATVVVLMILVFPEIIAGVLADCFLGAKE